MKQKFKHAWEGLSFLFFQDKNIRLQFLLGGISIVFGLILHLSKTEWIVVFACIALVIAFEIINSCIERVCDFIHPNYHIEIKYIKDGTAAAVLVISIFSLIAALIIFLPKISIHVLHYIPSIHFS